MQTATELRAAQPLQHAHVLPATGYQAESSMHVDLALFDGDVLLERARISVGPAMQTSSLQLFQAHHQLVNDTADITLDGFADRVGLKRVALNMPVHESGDWESIELNKFTMAFWCRLDA